MNLILFLLTLVAYACDAFAQNPYTVGHALGVTAPSGDFVAMSDNVRVYGGIVSAESCVYDTARQLILLPNQGARQRVQPNDAWVSLLHPDGALHTARWIGAQRSAEDRAALTPALELNDPFGTEIAGGVYYVADSEGGTGEGDERVSVLRRFDLATGAPLSSARIVGSDWINDIAVDGEGTTYATQSGQFGPEADPDSWRVYRVTAAGEVSIVLAGAPLHIPNGIAFDGDSNLVVANYGDSAVHTLSTSGELLATEYAAQPGSDGVVILVDGTKYVSSVTQGGISRIRPGEAAELIATGIPGAASMCFDPDRRRLVVPMTSQSGVGFVAIE